MGTIEQKVGDQDSPKNIEQKLTFLGSVGSWLNTLRTGSFLDF